MAGTDRLGLIRPIVEQSQYNLFVRSQVDYEFRDLYKRYKLGLTTWGPLHSGVLTGKYSAGVPEGSRYNMELFKKFGLTDDFFSHVKMADKMKPIADKLGCSLAQMALAWILSNDNVSTVLVGASKPAQLEENVKALAFVEKMTPEIKAEIDSFVHFVPTPFKTDQFAYARSRHL